MSRKAARHHRDCSPRHLPPDRRSTKMLPRNGTYRCYGERRRIASRSMPASPSVLRPPRSRRSSLWVSICPSRRPRCPSSSYRRVRGQPPTPISRAIWESSTSNNKRISLSRSSMRRLSSCPHWTSSLTYVISSLFLSSFI